MFRVPNSICRHTIRYAIMFAYTSCWYRLKRSQPMPKMKNVFREMDCSYWNSPTADTIISRLPELIPESLKAGRLGRYVPQTLLRLMSQLKSQGQETKHWSHVYFIPKTPTEFWPCAMRGQVKCDIIMALRHTRSTLFSSRYQGSAYPEQYCQCLLRCLQNVMRSLINTVSVH